MRVHILSPEGKGLVSKVTFKLLIHLFVVASNLPLFLI